ncbi:AraC family transcriptional regulator [Rhizobium rhizogenes]|uniref:helix-turn-helix domain-containing protein n=1 Tax=Rhizobium rhizogenes TaxID=359 RepID=UPI003ECEDE29
MDQFGNANLRKNSAANVLLSSRHLGWAGLDAELLHIRAGRTYVPGLTSHRLGVHFGRAVNAHCQCDGRYSRRIQKHGDIDVVPAGLDGWWEDDTDCTILRLSIGPELFSTAATAMGHNPETVSLAPKFQLRDARVESIAWAIKTELEASVPSDRLYAETLALALAVRLVENENPSGGEKPATRRSLSALQRRRLGDFIEDHIDQSLSLTDLAVVAGLSISHLKPLFRASFGMPMHQYVLTRRVERARLMLLSEDMPLSQVALETGFAHQSHMAHWMRRILGITPGMIARTRQ